MRKLRELFGGHLGEILKELEPIIVKVLESYLIGLLSGATVTSSDTPKKAGAGAGAAPATGVTFSPEQAKVLTLLNAMCQGGWTAAARRAAKEAMAKSSGSQEGSPASATGGENTPADRSE